MKEKLLKIEYFLLSNKYSICIILLSYIILLVLKDVFLGLGFSQLKLYVIMTVISVLMSFLFRFQIYFTYRIRFINKEGIYGDFKMDWGNISIIVPILLLIAIIRGFAVLLILKYNEIHSISVLVNFGILIFLIPLKAKNDIKNKLN